MPFKDKAAEKAYRRKYYLEHADEFKSKAKARYYADPQKVIDNSRKWRLANHDKFVGMVRKSNRRTQFNYTDDWSKVPGYDRLIADGCNEFNMCGKWVCHHILEEYGLPKEVLIKINMYYNRPPEELRIMTRSEHKTLHNKLRNNAR